MADPREAAAFGRIEFERLISETRAMTGRTEAEALDALHRVIDATRSTVRPPSEALAVFRACLIHGEPLNAAADRAARWVLDPVAAAIPVDTWLQIDRSVHPGVEYALRDLGTEIERATGIRAAAERVNDFLGRLIARLHHRRDPR